MRRLRPLLADAVTVAILALAVGGATAAPSATGANLLALVGEHPPVPARPIAPPFPTAAARVLHVAGWGDDAGDGSAAAPWRTVARALTSVRPGDAIELSSGRYPPFTLSATGRPDAWIVIRAAAGAGVTIDAGGGETAVDVEGARYVALAGATFTGSGDPFGAGVLVRRSRGVAVVGSRVVDNRGFGLRIVDSSDVTVLADDIAHDATGVELEGAVGGTEVAANAIHDQDRMVVDDPAPDNDRGAVGVNLYHVVGPVSIVRNRLWGDRAPSHDYGTDGGAFDLFGAKDVTIASNVIGPGNDSVLEAGTDGPLIQRVTFVDNTAYDATGSMRGIIVHAGDSLSVTSNLLVGLRDFALTVTGTDRFAGPISWLAVTDNVVVPGNGVTWSVWRPLPSTVRMDENTFACPSGAFATVAGQGTLETLADFRAATGLDRRSAIAQDARGCGELKAEVARTLAAAGIPPGA